MKSHPVPRRATWLRQSPAFCTAKALRFGGWLAGAVVFCAAAGGLRGQGLADGDFDALETGLAPGTGSPAGAWEFPQYYVGASVAETNPSMFTIAVAPGGSASNHCLRISARASDPGNQHLANGMTQEAAEAPGRRVDAAYDIYVAAGHAGGGYYLGAGGFNAAPERGPQMYWDAGGQYGIITAEGVMQPLGAYEQGVWMSVRLEADLVSDSFSLFVAPRGQPPVLAGAGLPFRSGRVDFIDRFGVGRFAAMPDVEAYLDNVILRVTTNVVAGSLGVALGAPQLSWTNLIDGGEFKPASGESPSGGDAAVCSATGALRTRVTGPGTFEFSWRVSSRTAETDQAPVVFVMVSGEQWLTVDTWNFGPEWRRESVVIPPGAHDLEWTLVFPDESQLGDGYLSDVVFIPSCGEPASVAAALDTPAWSWTQACGLAWTPAAAAGADGGSAAQSPALLGNQRAWLETVVTGPGEARFWWKAAPGTIGGGFEFLMDGEPSGLITGGEGWVEHRQAAGPGTHTLRWLYHQGLASPGQAWLDRVSFGVPPPVIGALDGAGAGSFGFTFSAMPGSRVVVEGSTDLRGWIPLSTNLAGAGPVPFADPESAGRPHRYYRLRAQ